ncbi:ceramidase domain-containing protein [Paraflavitalea pollutisoli]|uniref:ceramidase domain-containing protein n=1 Tax=Paraflavitalea pollutisoli TaxID=3034143 RepID=UPI0023ED7F89|nr:ceramidase domain-containing protein [Paraflavitalea sp. H1-2-19X]
MDKKSITLIVITIVLIVLTALQKPFSQPASYHQFADQVSFWGISNAWNVLTNLPFIIVGGYGLYCLTITSTSAAIKRMYTILFLGIILTGIGSAFYHLVPDNFRLLFDRLPMTIIFMSFLAITVYEWISPQWGNRLFYLLLLVGFVSLGWWYYTEQQGRGDLRFYLFVQFYPMLAIPLIYWLYRSPEKNRKIRILIWVFLWYIVAKVAEVYDEQLFAAIGFSGHSIKHLAAAVATWYMVRFYEKYYQASPLLALPA